MSNQQWLVQWRQIVWNAIVKISLKIENTTNNNEKGTNNTLSTSSNSKMPNQKSSSAMIATYGKSDICEICHSNVWDSYTS